MDRREFFRRGFGRVAEQAVKHVDKKVTERATRWVRPPFAIPELEFLLACTRCNACIDACSYNIVFPLASDNGADVMKTPALDLLNNGCHLCSDWPCVAACETGALTLPLEPESEGNDESSNIDFNPRLALINIDPETCLPYQGPECGACRSACTIDGAMNWERERPSINQEYCTGCAMCREACITEPKAVKVNQKII